jgi:hypothetical protein
VTPHWVKVTFSTLGGRAKNVSGKVPAKKFPHKFRDLRGKGNEGEWKLRMIHHNVCAAGVHVCMWPGMKQGGTGHGTTCTVRQVQGGEVRRQGPSQEVVAQVQLPATRDKKKRQTQKW